MSLSHDDPNRQTNQYQPDESPAPTGSCDTSIEAARSLPGQLLARIRRMVFHAIEETKSNGFTPDELAEHLGMEITSVRPRCTELLQSKAICRSGERRKSRSGRSCHVLIARRYADSEVAQ